MRHLAEKAGIFNGFQPMGAGRKQFLKTSLNQG